MRKCSRLYFYRDRLQKNLQSVCSVQNFLWRNYAAVAASLFYLPLSLNKNTNKQESFIFYLKLIVCLGGAAELSNLCVGDEILAINSVRLSSSLTQDDIVQLIVESVIKGSLLLGVRRYGKSKKGKANEIGVHNFITCVVFIKVL